MSSRVALRLKCLASASLPSILVLVLYLTWTFQFAAANEVVRHFRKDTLCDSYKEPFYIDIVIEQTSAKCTRPTVKFVSFSPVTGHTSEFSTVAKLAAGGQMKFSFVDSWGTKGKGTIKITLQGAVVHLEKIASAPNGMNAGESWPDNEIIPRSK